MPTFAELEIPFPLFDAEVEGTDYAGVGTCSLCSNSKRHLFDLGIGCALMVTCQKCATPKGLDAYDQKNGRCSDCGNDIPFPNISHNEIRCCYECLRSGHASITSDTELGMISWEQSLTGVTHGVPGLNNSDFEMVSTDSEWVGARLDLSHINEILRTPNFSTWQGERWLFCCKQPMVYIGSWEHDDFDTHAPNGDGRSFFLDVVDDAQPEMWDTNYGDCASYYAFRCNGCNHFRVNWDMG